MFRLILVLMGASVLTGCIQEEAPASPMPALVDENSPSDLNITIEACRYTEAGVIVDRARVQAALPPGFSANEIDVPGNAIVVLSHIVCATTSLAYISTVLSEVPREGQRENATVHVYAWNSIQQGLNLGFTNGTVTATTAGGMTTFGASAQDAAYGATYATNLERLDSILLGERRRIFIDDGMAPRILDFDCTTDTMRGVLPMQVTHHSTILDDFIDEDQTWAQSKPGLVSGTFSFRPG